LAISILLFQAARVGSPHGKIKYRVSRKKIFRHSNSFLFVLLRGFIADFESKVNGHPMKFKPV